MLFSDMGGIDIEEVNEQHPDRVGRAHLSNLVEAPDFRAKEVIAQTGVTGRAADSARRRSWRGWRACSASTT